MSHKVLVVFVILIFYSFLSYGSVGEYTNVHTSGQTGLFECYSANTLGFTKLVLNLSTDFAYDEKLIYRMRNLETNEVVTDNLKATQYGIYPALAFGITDFLDFSIVQPIYFDIIHGVLPAGGSGDLKVALKCRIPGSKPRIVEGALLTDFTFPNGNKAQGYFMRHTYYLERNSSSSDSSLNVPVGFFSAKKPTWEFRLLGTIGKRNVFGHVNIGTRITFDKELDNVLSGGIGIEYQPTEWVGLFADVYAEPRFKNIADGFKITNDPFHFSPGITFRAPRGANLSLGGSFKLSSNKEIAYQSKSSDMILYTKTEPFWRLFIKLGWNGFIINRDKDNDMLRDKDDACPDVAEDIDNFEDKDGCPDLDNDQDKIPDDVDSCQNEPEDMDGVEDGDGCPDYDNDSDGIPDSVDRCTEKAEDRDGFEDDDGCPDFDDDGDNVLDSLDKCKGAKEDIDGFEDDDGCPDFDNDLDAVPDSIDKCPDNAGIGMDDGCPEPKEKAKEITYGRLILSGVTFSGGSADLTLSSAKDLDRVYQSLADWPEVKIEIQAHTDNSANAQASLTLSQMRADVVRDYLIEKGIDSSRLTSVGKGSGEPIADNKTVQGRSLNNRVEIHRID